MSYSGRIFTKFSFHQSFLRIYSFQYLDSDLSHSHRPQWSVTGQKFNQNREISVKEMAKKVLLKNLPKSLLLFWRFSVYQSFLWERTLSASIVSWLALSSFLTDLASWLFKKYSVKRAKFGSRKTGIWNYTIRLFVYMDRFNKLWLAVGHYVNIKFSH